jgi:hypothetical protein
MRRCLSSTTGVGGLAATIRQAVTRKKVSCRLQSVHSDIFYISLAGYHQDKLVVI